MSKKPSQFLINKYEKAAIDFLNTENKTLKEYCSEKELSYPGFYKYLSMTNRKVKRQENRPLRKANDAIREQIVNEYENNEFISIKSLARTYKVSEPTISRWLKLADVKIRRKHNVKECDLMRAVKYYLDGMNSRAAARKARIGKETLRKYLRDKDLLRKENIIQADKMYDESFFDQINTEEKAYWFGFIFADGSVRIAEDTYSVAIEIQESDIDMLHLFNKSLHGNLIIKHRRRKNPTGSITKMCSLTIYSKHMAEALAAKGCKPNKTYEGEIMKHVIEGHELKMAFVRGYVDGDGFISKPGVNIFSIVVRSNKVANYLNRIIIEETGAIPTFHYEKGKNGDAYRLRITNQTEFEMFLSKLYENATIFMERKHKRYLSHSRLETSSQKSQDDESGIKLEGPQA